MAQLKHQIDTLDGLEPSLHTFYEKGSDGKYFLQVQGMVAKSVVDEFRTNNITMANQLKAFDGVDAAEYKRLKELEGKFTGKPDEAAVEKAVQERVATMKADFDTRYKAVADVNGTMKSQLEVLVIDNAVRAAATKAGVRPEAVDDVLLRAKTVFKFENGSAVPYDSKGQLVYGKDGTTPMTTEEWATGLKKTATHLFPQSAGGGAGGPGKGGGVGGQNLSPTDKIKAGLEQRQT